MHRMTLTLSLAFVAATAVAARGEVNVDVHIGVPAPVVVAPAPAIIVAPPPPIVASPQIVVVPGTRVHHAPSAGFNVFLFGGKYYSLHNGHWFVATGAKRKWKAISAHHVPAPVLSVPVAYYKIPPGHHGHGHGGKHRRDR